MTPEEKLADRRQQTREAMQKLRADPVKRRRELDRQKAKRERLKCEKN